MAALTKTQIANSVFSGAVTMNSSSGSDTVALTSADDNIRLLVQNTDSTNDATITIKANGFGTLAPLGDVVFTAAKGSGIYTVLLDNIGSSRVKDASGNLTINASGPATIGNVKIGVIEAL